MYFTANQLQWYRPQTEEYTMQNSIPTPTSLLKVATGRDHITTAEFAHATKRASQTIRKNYCLTGECFGIRPIKFGNRLLWPVAKIAVLLTGGA